MIVPFRGKEPKIAPDVFIAENAAVAGDVTIGPGSSVWFGAAVRGDAAPITIGAGTNIQDSATLHCDPGHPLRVGDNVTVGHNAVVHCAEVGDNTLVGMGACLLTGAVIGRDCIIAAGAVVTQDAVVPDRTLMAGVPAKPVKTLPPEYIEYMEKQSLYVELAEEYRTCAP